eukprot:gb/GECH01007266.1/.p1 GENE.gb/GECH01007266.1/~~gb/GECH01007266.1/.p1  ORF type:complete len:915 (+),score=164.86 gb/GECH01007266.1/:1-2745(+)
MRSLYQTHVKASSLTQELKHTSHPGSRYFHSSTRKHFFSSYFFSTNRFSVNIPQHFQQKIGFQLKNDLLHCNYSSRSKSLKILEYETKSHRETKFQASMSRLRALGRKQGFEVAFQEAKKYITDNTSEYTAITILLSTFVQDFQDLGKLTFYSVSAWDQDSQVYLINAFIHRKMRQNIKHGFFFFNFLRSTNEGFNLRTIHLMLRNTRSRFGGLELAERVLLCARKENPRLKLFTKTYNLLLAVFLSHVSQAQHLQSQKKITSEKYKRNTNDMNHNDQHFNSDSKSEYDDSTTTNFDENDDSNWNENHLEDTFDGKDPVLVAQKIRNITDELLPFESYETDIKELGVDPNPPMTKHAVISRLKSWCHWFEHKNKIKPDSITINTILSININAHNQKGWWLGVRKLWTGLQNGNIIPSGRSSVLLLLGLFRFQRGDLSSIANTLERTQLIGQDMSRKNFNNVSWELGYNLSESQMQLVLYLAAQRFAVDASGISILLDEAMNRKRKEYRVALALIRVTATKKIPATSRLIASVVGGFFDSEHFAESLSLLGPQIPNIAFHQSQLEFIDDRIGLALAQCPQDQIKPLVRVLNSLYPIGLRTTSLRLAFGTLEKEGKVEHATTLFHYLSRYMDAIPSRVLNASLKAIVSSSQPVTHLLASIISQHPASISMYTIATLMELCTSVSQVTQVLDLMETNDLTHLMISHEEYVLAHAVVSIEKDQLSNLFQLFRQFFHRSLPNLEFANQVLNHLSERDASLVEHGLELMVEYNIIPSQQKRSTQIRIQTQNQNSFYISGDSRTFDILLDTYRRTQNTVSFTQILIQMLNQGLLWSQSTFEMIYWMARKTNNTPLAVAILESMGRNGVWMRKLLVQDAKTLLQGDDISVEDKEQILNALKTPKTARDPNEAKIEPPDITFD